MVLFINLNIKLHIIKSVVTWDDCSSFTRQPPASMEEHLFLNTVEFCVLVGFLVHSLWYSLMSTVVYKSVRQNRSCMRDILQNSDFFQCWKIQVVNHWQWVERPVSTYNIKDTRFLRSAFSGQLCCPRTFRVSLSSQQKYTFLPIQNSTYLLLLEVQPRQQQNPSFPMLSTPLRVHDEICTMDGIHRSWCDAKDRSMKSEDASCFPHSECNKSEPPQLTKQHTPLVENELRQHVTESL